MWENRCDNGLFVGNNESLKYGKEILEKSVSEWTKEKDSYVNDEEFVKHKNREQWGLIDECASIYKLYPKHDQVCVWNKRLQIKD